ncbi:MAG: V-type ATPase subunit [Thermoplasmata archaeon]
MNGITASDNFPYLCTRIKVKTLELYTREELQRMLDMDVREILRYLHEGTYKEEIEKGSIEYRFSVSDVIEYALNKNLSRSYIEIYRMASAGAKVRLEAFLSKLDAWNLKTYLRGLHSHATREEILKHMFGSGKYSEEFWRNAMEAQDIEKYFEKTEYREIVREYLAEKNLTKIEDLIDRNYYINLLANAKKMQFSRADMVFVEFVQKEIDLKNLQTAMKIIFYRQSTTASMENLIESSYIPGGWSISPQKFRKFCESKDYEALLQNIGGMWFEKEMRAIFSECKGSCSIQINRLEYYLAKIAENFSVIYPISILPVISYLLKKRIEVENIRIIARGKSHGLSREHIIELLGW